MSLEKAKQELGDALTAVAQLAQEVADTAEYHDHKTGGPLYLVGLEDMDDLKAAVKVWKEKTQNFLSEVQKAGG